MKKIMVLCLTIVVLLLLLSGNSIQAVNGAGPDYNAQISDYVNELKEDGSFRYHFDASNGISQEENGVGGQFAHGSSKYYTPEGQLIQLTYTADADNGFLAQGTHLPTPPPIPEAILKSLEYIRLHPYNEPVNYYSDSLQRHRQSNDDGSSSSSSSSSSSRSRSSSSTSSSASSSSNSNRQYYQQLQQQKFFYRKF